MRGAHIPNANNELLIRVRVDGVDKTPVVEAVESNGAAIPFGKLDEAPKPKVTAPRDFGWIAGRVFGAAAGALIGAAVLSQVFLNPGAPPSESTLGTCEQRRELIDRAAMSPLGEDARLLATDALRLRPDQNHAYLAYKEEIRRRLERLGLLVASGDHVHISDVDLEHGGAVIRSALGLNPLVTVTSTMSVGDVPEELARQSLRPEQYMRLAPIFLERMRTGGPDEDGPRDVPSFIQLLESALIDFEWDILEKKMRLELLRQQRSELPSSARLFVNMSFGTSRDRAAGQLANVMLTAPPDSELYQLAVRVLGGPPVPPPDDGGAETAGGPDCGGRSRLRPRLPTLRAGNDMPPEIAAYMAQVEKLKRDLIYPQLDRLLAQPDVRHILDTARRDFEREVARSRQAGILLFEAAGNEYSDAAAAGRPAMSESTTAGIRGVLLVGAVDLAQPLDPRDDRVAPFSAAGNISFVAPGVNLPVWQDGRRLTEQAGTSFASPIALEVAAALGAIAPNISIDRIERFLRDNRVAIPIPRERRAGAGVLDAFAAVLLGANPRLTRAQIDDAWRALGDPNADIDAIRRSLQLPPITPPAPRD